MISFCIYKDKKSEFRWRIRAANGKIIADCAEGYKSKSDCEHGLSLVRDEAAGAAIKDETAE